MANQDMHRSKVPSEPELDLNLYLGIGSSGKFYPIPPQQNPPPPPSSTIYVSAHRGSTMSPNNGKERADIIKELQASRRREARMRLSAKKKARGANKEVTPALALSIRSTVSQASGTSDGAVATLAGTQLEQLPKLNQRRIDAPPQTMVVPSTGGKGKAPVMHTQSDHKAKSPNKMAPYPNDSTNMSRDQLLRLIGVMPRVTTSGGVPNGKTIEGLFIKFAEPGHNVLIVCLCHGKYHSPEEFVQHAGGLDVSNCMKYIKIDP